MTQEVFLEGNNVIGMDGRQQLCVAVDTIKMVCKSWHEQYLAWPDVFSVLILPETFLLIGPKVAYCLEIIDAIRQVNPDIPVQEVFFNSHTFPWRLRDRTGGALRILPTPGFGLFPRSKLPAYTVIEPTPQDRSS